MAKKRKITKKQYDKAKETVSEYEAQLSLSLVSRLFTEDDLWELSGTISVPSLTMDIVDEDYASKIEDKLEEKGYSIDYVSLDDMGHISIRFYGGQYHPIITEQHKKDVLDVLNDD